MQLNQQVNEIFAPLWLEDDWRYAILMGGRGTGRSTGGSQFDLSQLTSPNYHRSAIMRENRSDIKSSVFQDLMDHIDEQGIRNALHITEGNDMTIQYGKNSIKAHGFRSSSGSTNNSKLKSLANYNCIRIEEAKEVGEAEFMQLDDSIRTVKGKISIIFQTNPPQKNHWLVQRFFDLEEHPDWPGFYIPHPKTDTDDKFIYIGGTYLDNIANLDETTIKRYAGYERTNQAYFCQEILGLIPDEVRGKIYRNWRTIEGIPRGARFVGFGLDFGWFPDPAAIVAIWYADGEYIIDEVAYGHEIENEMLATEMRTYVSKHQISEPIVIADAAEPKSIAAINKRGIKVLESLKGSDAESYRIKCVSTKRISVTKRSTHVWEEYENYAWAEDKDGNPKGKPVHTYSHSMDAIGMFFAWQEGGEVPGTRVSISTPTFKSYGHAGAMKVTKLPTPGHGVKINIPGRK